MLRFGITCLATLLCHGLSAQIGYNTAGSRGHAMGNANLALSDVYSAGNNQAGLAWLETPQIGLSAMQLFGLDGVNALWGVAAIPTAGGTFGFSFEYLGDVTFNQAKAGLGFGKRLGEKMSAGIQLDYCQTRVDLIGSGSSFTFEAGLQYKPVPKLLVAARSFNPISVSAGEDFDDERLPTLFALALAYMPADQFFIAIEAEQDLENDLQLRFGTEYKIVEQLALRGGYMTGTQQFTAGFGIYWKELILDAAAQFHPQLGPSPSMAIQYQF